MTDTDKNVITVGGPYFEDFAVGQVQESPPSVTINEGHAAIHEAMFADRLRLPLDKHLSQKVTGAETALVNPSLFCNIAIGQTTFASQRVKANLFYRGLMQQRPVFVGDTLYTATKVVALKQNKAKPGRAATGLVALEMTVTNQRDEEVMTFWRCPMIPCRDKEANTGHADSFDAMPDSLDMAAVAAALPSWNLRAWRAHLGGQHFADVEAGSKYTIDSRDTVTSAPELVRMTLNMAVAHTDAGRSVYNKRLVYGGHTISMAAAQIVRAFPNMLNIVAWHGCDHTGPVFENDILRSEVTVTGKHELGENGGLLDLQIIVYAERGDQAPEPGKDIPVLDFRPVVWLA